MKWNEVKERFFWPGTWADFETFAQHKTQSMWRSTEKKNAKKLQENMQ